VPPASNTGGPPGHSRSALDADGLALALLDLFFGGSGSSTAGSIAEIVVGRLGRRRARVQWSRRRRQCRHVVDAGSRRGRARAARQGRRDRARPPWVVIVGQARRHPLEPRRRAGDRHDLASAGLADGPRRLPRLDFLRRRSFRRSATGRPLHSSTGSQDEPDHDDDDRRGVQPRVAEAVRGAGGPARRAAEAAHARRRQARLSMEGEDIARTSVLRNNKLRSDFADLFQWVRPGLACPGAPREPLDELTVERTPGPIVALQIARCA
jgi:hypothetical protein